MITRWQAPKGAGVRLDTATRAGQKVLPYYDSMIAKLIVHGTDRADALERGRQALAAFGVGGIKTTIGFHRMLIDHSDFEQNAIHTRWIEDVFSAPEEA